MSDNQAQADSPDLPTVADPLEGAANSTTSGTNPIAAYEAELAAALAGDAVTDGQAAEAAGEDTDAPEAQDGEDAAAEAVADEATEEFSDEEEHAEVKASGRFRFKDPADQAVAAIAKAKGITLIEAARLYEGEIPTKREDDATEQVAADVETVASVSVTIEELRKQKREANAALEFETANDLDEQIDALRDRRDDLKQEEAAARASANAREENAFYDNYAKSETRTLGFYPDLLDPKSPMSVRVGELDRQAQAMGDPLYHSDNKPFLLAKAAALELGKLMANPDKQKPASKQAIRPMHQPASGNARTTATAPAVRQEEAIDKINGIQDYEKFVADCADLA